MRAGWPYGAAAFGIVFLVLLVAAVIPATNGFLHGAVSATSRPAITAGEVALIFALVIGRGLVRLGPGSGLPSAAGQGACRVPRGPAMRWQGPAPMRTAAG